MSKHSMRHSSGNVVCRLSAQAMGMEAAALCHRSHWVPKSSRSTCSNCRRNFRLWAGKHHCRLCGEIVCRTCSTKRILFQSKSVRTCDDCVNTNVQNMSETTPQPSTSRLLRSKSIPAAFDSHDVYERRSLQQLPVRPASSRSLETSLSMTSRAMTPTATTSCKRTTTFASKERVGTKCHLTVSSPTQLVSLVLVAFIVVMVGASTLVVQVST